MVHSRVERGGPRRILSLVASAGFLGLAASSAMAQAPGGGNSAPPAVVVTAIQNENVAASQQFLGRIQAIQQVDIVARVEGFLDQVAFQEGAFVDKGQLLYQIEKDQYQAQLDAANAQLATAKAQKSGAEAQLKNAQANLNRQQTLLERQTVSQAVVDQAQAQRDEAAASVQSGQAAIEQANAQIETAKINLGYTTINSPIKGRIGATNVTQGNLVNTQSGTLATVVQLDPIRMVFSIPETYWIQFAQEKGINAASAEGVSFVPTIELPTGKTYEPQGKIAFVSNEVDQTTGTIAIYTDFPNPDGALLPGGFVTAIVRQAQQQNLPVVPLSAVQQDRQGRYVFVLGTDNKVSERRIETSVQVQDGWAVTSGLQSGETVVVQGVQKIQPGMTVSPTSVSFQNASQAGQADPSQGQSSGNGGSSGSQTSGSDNSGTSGSGSDSTSSGSGSSGSSGSGSSSAPASGSSSGTGGSGSDASSSGSSTGGSSGSSSSGSGN
ncbi:efflux RND transporter periplasmic adaptor subunit [Amorphus orientalis]|uniref:Membrane fusion protein (Multidrug efflux system) n=1 Tax=Amorphus orientalis TaxID=649198 RepID=A0AAE4ARG2_9HYPH|nr:efflux RND transporter periplasmic adaptor subunit [Amorphus orientalis]MDQ0313993.1 membrane fusion protein (multidrug efflux system) [Amorphus orientalis]